MAVRKDGPVPISLLTGPANAGKAQAVLGSARAHAARGLGPLLVVPTEADQARYRRELAEPSSGPPAFGVRVERFHGLLSEAVHRAGRGEQALGDLARERMLASILAQAFATGADGAGGGDDGPGGAGGGGVQPGLAAALARLVAELEAHRVAPARLREAVERAGRASESGSGEVSLARLCSVYETYRQALDACGRVDRELRVVRALDELRRRPALWGATPVLLYGFDSFTELQLDAIETLGRVVDVPVTVSLAYEPGRAAFAGRAHAFARLQPIAHAHSELPPRAAYYQAASRSALHHLERNLLEPGPADVQAAAAAGPADGDAGPVRVPAAGAVRLLEGSSPRAELELVAAHARALLDEGMPAEQIAVVHRSPASVAGLLAEAFDDFGVPHASRLPVAFAHTAIGRALLGLMRCAFADGQLGDLLAWLRAPGVLQHPQLADRLEAAALRRGATTAERARALWEAERWPLDRIDRLRQAAGRGPFALLDALGAELHSLFCAPRRRAAAVLDEDERQEGRALAGGQRALDRLRELARCAPRLFPEGAELTGVLAGLQLYGAWPSAAGRMLISDPLSLRARRVSVLFLCGLQEGVFPAPSRPDPLLGSEERRELARDGGLLLGSQSDPLAAERYLLYALCSRPERLLVLSWHTADENGSPAAPSLFLDDVCDLFTEDLLEQARRGRPPRYGSQRDGSPHGGDASGAGAGAAERQIAPLSHERVLATLRERTLWSASSLEAWTACPVRWFVERLLRLDGLDADPEPLARGALAHAALRTTLERLRQRTGSARITPASVGLAKRLLGQALDEHARERPLSSAPERLPGARRRLLAELERYLDHASQAPSPLEPAHLELEFGFQAESGGQPPEGGGRPPVGDGQPPEDGGRGLPALELGDGVKVRGRIDRVDVGPGGEAVVYDYKGRSAPPGARWASDGAFQLAIYMQAVESLLGHTAAGGFYQPLAGRDIRARGLLDTGSGLDLECVRTDRLQRAEIEEVLHECRQAALLAAAQARAGALQPRPATCSYNGGGCAYPQICRGNGGC